MSLASRCPLRPVALVYVALALYSGLLVVRRYHTRLGELTHRKEKAEKETLYWEHQAQASEQSATKRTLLLGRIRMATANLYALVNAHTPGSVR